MKTYLTTGNRFPEFFREEFPDLINFIEAYYRYIEEDTMNGRLQYVTDLDLVEQLDSRYCSVFIEHYKNQYAADVPTFQNMSDIEFLRNAGAVYSSRGTELCLKFLFRAAFGDDIDVSYPKFNMLRASDSTWTQEYHIRLSKIYSNIPNFKIVPYDKLEWSNNQGNYSVIVKRIININDQEVYLFFETNSKFYVETSSETNLQKFQIKRQGIKVYEGVIKKSLSGFQIINPGKFWQPGTVLKIRGPYSVNDTIIKIANTDVYGSVKEIDIVEYGWELDAGSGFIISPFKKPPTAEVNIDSILTGVSPVSYHWSIGITEITDGFSETLRGDSSIQTYYLSGDYYHVGAGENLPYFGSIALVQQIAAEPHKFYTLGTQVSINDWVASKTTIVSKSDYVVKDKGRFIDSTGLLNNRDAVLQDSKYYQSYSYVIESNRTYKEAATIIKFNHPAGTKMFINTKRQNSIKFGISSYRSISADFISVFDSVGITSKNVLHFTKSLIDSVSTTDNKNLKLNKVFSDSISFNTTATTANFTSYYEFILSEYFLGSTYYGKQLEISE